MNKVKQLFIFLINRPFYMKFLLIVMFVIYGAIISTLSYAISNYYQIQNTKEKIIKTQKESFNIKTDYLQDKIDSFIFNLEAIKSNHIFNQYLDDKSKKSTLEDIFALIMNSQKELSQLRFIDEKGYEKIRFDRKKIYDEAYKIVESELQDKSSRYYFKEIKSLKDNSVWFSKLDLNMEYGVIQKPIVPTLRIGTPIYKDGIFRGILIVNLFFENILETFVTSPFFYINIFDNDGEFIYNKVYIDNKLVDNSWSRYLKKNKENLQSYDEYKKSLFKNKYIKEYLFSQSIVDILPNGDNLSVQFLPKVVKLKKVHENDENYIFSVTILVLFISIPLALVIAYIPNLINTELYRTKKLLEEEAKVIDEYVYLTVTNKKGIIQDVSQAYLNFTGYSKEELIGNSHNILKDPDTSSTIYKNLWNTIINKKVWNGQLTNIKKDGTKFVVNVSIKPLLDENSEIKKFTAYFEDITYQKHIEKQSITDELTGLFNRREFNSIFDKQLINARESNSSYSMMILDIDYFKQFNDTYGHLEGDNTLKSVAEAISKCCKRSNDFAFRIGGEEFAIIFHSKTKDDAYTFALNINKAVEELQILHKKSQASKYVTVSIGLFFTTQVGSLTQDKIFQECDELLYKAKERGRNQVAVEAT